MFDKDYWDRAYQKYRKSPYIDRLVAHQKREEYERLVQAWLPEIDNSVILKTDMFEEAGNDRSFFDSVKRRNSLLGIDVSLSTLKSVVQKELFSCINADVRKLPFKDDVIGAVISPSTLDHFEDKGDIIIALNEIKRVLKKEGILLLTLDNSLNPLYWLLKIASFCKLCPVYIGKTLSMNRLEHVLKDMGFEVEDKRAIIHNPRLINTIVVWFIRKMLKKHADGAIKSWLALWARLEGKGVNGLTGCFIAIKARKKSNNKI